jgi:hypothetical protein
VRKYNASGGVVWTRQFGSSYSDKAESVAVDATGVYVVGHTTGVLPGQSRRGEADGFIRKFSFSGVKLWTSQFGTSSDDYALGLALDSGAVYVSGTVEGALPGQAHNGGYDAFVRRYNSSGRVVWTSQFGTTRDDWGQSVAVNSTGVYIDGYTLGALPGWTNTGGNDGFVRRYNASGAVVWTRQFGSDDEDIPYGLAANAEGVYLAGWAEGALPGQTHRGEDDAFIHEYNSAGNVVWTTQFGTATEDYAYDIGVTSTSVYLTGYTDGTLPGQTSAGGRDAFLRKYTAR